MPDEEKGVKVSDENLLDDEEWDDNYLEAIRFVGTTVRLESRRTKHVFDLRKVDEAELKSAKKVLKKMNYDKRFRLDV